MTLIVALITLILTLNVILNVIPEQKWSDPDTNESEERERRTSDSSELVEDGGNGLVVLGHVIAVSS